MRKLMAPQDAMAMTAVAMMEIAVNLLLDNTKRNTRRWNQLQAVKERIDKIDETYEGHLPQDWIERNMKMHQIIERELIKLMAAYRGDAAREQGIPLVTRDERGRFRRAA